VEDIT
jgi:hypothetical protein